MGHQRTRNLSETTGSTSMRVSVLHNPENRLDDLFWGLVKQHSVTTAVPTAAAMHEVLSRAVLAAIGAFL
jgi:hypothetical protein